jgi:serine O-acetyltransferase
MEPEQYLPALAEALVEGYRREARAQYINRRFLPSRDEILSIVQLLLQLFYPGYYGRQDLTNENLRVHVDSVLAALREKLERQIECCLCHRDARDPADPVQQAAVPVCRNRASVLTHTFLECLPDLRRRLVLDAQAALDGDPAAGSLDEIILSYPGHLAVTVYRVAHELDVLGIPLMPRIMSEWAHTQTGADIHPSATIGENFFIDHATGVVVGATSHIGHRVKLYQGVTLGALSLPRGADGRVVRHPKRHPTVEDDVTIYANATVLGGQTVIGKGSVVGGSVFVTRSVPEGHRVVLDPPKLRLAQTEEKKVPPDFDI